MGSKGKVWVIEADPGRRRKPAPPSQSRPAMKAGSSPANAATGPKTITSRAAAPETSRQDRPAQRIAMAYLLGNLGPYLQQRDDRSPVWAGIGLGAVLVWVLTLGQWNAIAGWLGSGTLPFAVWIPLMGTLSLLGLAAGARALLQVGRESNFIVARLPVGLRHPKVIGLLGFLVPGSGLLCTGHPWKAASAYVNAGVTTLALVTVLRWNDLWALHQQSGDTGLASATLERLFVACLAVILAGSFVWVYNAFDGARHASRLQDRVNTLGPWWVLPAFAVQLFLLSSFDAGARARDLDRLAAQLAQQGYTYVPYHIERLALRMDPSNVEHLVHAAQMADELGRVDQGRHLRLQAATHWERAMQVIDVMQPEHLAAAPVPPDHVEDTQPAVPETPAWSPVILPPQQLPATPGDVPVPTQGTTGDTRGTAAATDSTTKHSTTDSSTTTP